MPNALLDLFHKEVLSDWFAMIGGIGVEQKVIRGIARVGMTGEEIVGCFVTMLCQGKAVPICAGDAPR